MLYGRGRRIVERPAETQDWLMKKVVVFSDSGIFIREQIDPEDELDCCGEDGEEEQDCSS
jgi:hypothetical protein